MLKGKLPTLKDKLAKSLEIVPALEKVEVLLPKPKRFRKPLKVGASKKSKKK